MVDGSKFQTLFAKAAEHDAAEHTPRAGAPPYTWSFRNFAQVLTKQVSIQGFQARPKHDHNDVAHRRQHNQCCYHHRTLGPTTTMGAGGDLSSHRTLSTTAVWLTQARTHFDLFPEYVAKMEAWLESGDVRYQECIAHGIDALPGALISMLGGANRGKQLVQLSHDAFKQGAGEKDQGGATEEADAAAKKKRQRTK